MIQTRGKPTGGRRCSPTPVSWLPKPDLPKEETAEEGYFVSRNLLHPVCSGRLPTEEPLVPAGGIMAENGVDPRCLEV